MPGQGQGRANALVVVVAAILLVVALFVVPTNAQGGYCVNDNPFSGGQDCTQFDNDVDVDAARSACAVGVSMPGQSGEFTPDARCPLYSDPDKFGGECSRVTEQGLAVKSVLELREGAPLSDCAGIEQVCTTFVQGDFIPSPACGGSLGSLPEGDEEVETVETGSENLPDEQRGTPIAADVETLADGFQFTEGPIWIPTEGADPNLPPSTLLFSDMRADKIFAWSEARGLETFANDSRGANGKALDGEGRLVTFRHGPRDVARGAAMENATVLADTFQGKRLNSPNDGAVSPADGSVYFSDPIWGIFIRDPQGMELDRHSVYRISPTGDITEVLADTAMPNGIAFSPDGKVLFVSDTGGLSIHPNPDLAATEPPASIKAWKLDETTGGVADRKNPLWKREDFSDGMCVNDRGLWTTRGGMAPANFGPPGLVLSDPETGEEIGHIDIEDPTNVECNAEDGKIYVTAANKVVRVTLLE